MLTEADIQGLLACSEPLVFAAHGAKMYARTPAGEYAYADSQGLYEWRDGQRIHYSGGDQQASDASGFYQRDDIVNKPFLRGLESLRSRRRLN